MELEQKTQQQEARLSWATKINYGIGTTGRSLSNGLSGRMQYYLLTVLRMNRGLVGPMLVAGRIWDGLNDLLMGTIIDNTRTKWGKFRPWWAIGTVTNAIVMVGLFGGPAGLRGSPGGQFAYMLVLWLLWDATYTMVDVAYWSMIPALTSHPKERDQISTIPRIFGGVFGVATVFNMQIIKFLGQGDEFVGFRYFAMITSVVYIITSLYGAMTVREPKAALPEEKKEIIGLGKALSILWNNKQALVVVVVMILFNLASNLTNGVSIFYFLFVLKNDAQFSFFQILGGVGSALGTFCFPLYIRWLGRRKVYSIAFALPVVGCLGLGLANRFMYGSFPPLVIPFFIGMIGFGLMGVIQNVMLADSVDYGEVQTGQRNEGIIFCTLTMISKLAWALNDLVSVVVFSIVSFGGQDAVTATPEAVKGINWLLYVLPPVAMAVSFAVYRGFYKLHPEKMAEIRAALEARKLENA